MVNDYKEIEMYGAKTYEWYKGILLKERLLHSKILELFLESVKPLEEESKNTDYRKLALLTLATRLFNDAEGANYLLLRGLPSQAQMNIRDIIECTMLFRWFLKNPILAKRWLMESKEYHLKYVNAELLRMNVNAREYAYYGPLSHQGHSNLLGSISNIQEEEVEEGMLRTFRFGSSRTSSTIIFVQYSFVVLFFLFYLLLTEPLSEYYSQHSESVVYSAWAEKMGKLIPELASLAKEGAERSGDEISEEDKHIMKRIEKRMRLKEFKKRLSGSEEVSIKEARNGEV